MKTQNFTQILKGILLAYLAVITSCSTEDSHVEIQQKGSVECTSFMIPDEKIQDYYDSGINVPRPEDTHLKALLHYNISVKDF